MVSDSQELKLQAIGSQQLWVLGTELGLYKGCRASLTTEPSLQPLMVDI